MYYDHCTSPSKPKYLTLGINPPGAPEITYVWGNNPIHLLRTVVAFINQNHTNLTEVSMCTAHVFWN